MSEHRCNAEIMVWSGLKGRMVSVGRSVFGCASARPHPEHDHWSRGQVVHCYGKEES